MGLLSIGQLAARRRGISQVEGAAVSGRASSALTALEAAIPTEVVALYTAIIAACESVRIENSGDTYPQFRLAVWLLGLLGTAVASTQVVARWTRKDSTSEPRLWSVEAFTAVFAFAIWGLVLPGSFIYIVLPSSVLSLTVATVAALGTFVLAVVLGPILRIAEPQPVDNGSGPPIVDEPPTSEGGPPRPGPAGVGGELGGQGEDEPPTSEAGPPGPGRDV